MIKIKSYLPEDVNAAGVSRKGWRLIHFVGNDAFLASIAIFPDDYLFPLSSSGVMIKGGRRVCNRRKDLTPQQNATITAAITAAITPPKCRARLGAASPNVGGPSPSAVPPAMNAEKNKAKPTSNYPQANDNPDGHSMSEDTIDRILTQASGEVFRRNEVGRSLRPHDISHFDLSES